MHGEDRTATREATQPGHPGPWSRSSPLRPESVTRPHVRGSRRSAQRTPVVRRCLTSIRSPG